MQESLLSRIVGHWARCDRRQLRDVGGAWLTTHELEERSRRAAHSLVGAGLHPGQRLLLRGASSSSWVIGLLGALRAGLTVVPLNPSYTPAEVRRIVESARPAAALLEDPEDGIRLAGSSKPIRALGLEELECLPATGGSIDLALPEDIALLMFTSGTTGRPKGVPLSHANLLAGVRALELAWRMSPEDVLLLTLPLFHVHGLGVGLLASLCAGGAIDLRPSFDAGDVAERAGAGASLFFGVPATYERIVRADRAKALRSLRLLVSGSASLPAELALEVAREAGQIPLERYGMTETMMLTSNPYEGERKPGSVGLPLPGVELRLVGEGEVQVRGPSVIKRYWDGIESEAFTADRWFATGDVGERDGDGYLRLVGRSKELIITGGFNVHPREVEEVLAQYPGVAEVAVVGRPSRRWGEEVTAVIVCSGELDEDAVLSLAREHLAPYKVSKRIERAAELPRNALGKLVRAEL